MEIIVETHQQALRQADVFCRNNDTEGKSAQYKDYDCDQRTDEYRFRIVLGGIVYILHMDTAHFHSGIEEEDTCGKHHIVKIRQVREETAVEVHVGVAARSEIDNAQNNQQGRRDDSTDHATHLCHFSYPAHAFH